MVNGLHLYSTFLVFRLLKALYATCQHSPIHTHIHSLMAVAAMQGAAHQEQFVVQYLAQGHFNMQTGGAGNRTANLPISGRPALPLSHSHPVHCRWFISTLQTDLYEHYKKTLSDPSPPQFV